MICWPILLWEIYSKILEWYVWTSVGLFHFRDLFYLRNDCTSLTCGFCSCAQIVTNMEETVRQANSRHIHYSIWLHHTLFHCQYRHLWVERMGRIDSRKSDGYKFDNSVHNNSKILTILSMLMVSKARIIGTINLSCR